MSYGDQHAATADAVAALLTTSILATMTAGELAVEVRCRDAVFVAATRRLDLVLAGAAPLRSWSATALAAAPALVLRDVAHATPMLGSTEVPLSDALAEKYSGYVGRWQAAARHATMATEDLTSTAVWGHPARLWHLTADAADLLEAVAVLDRDLATLLSDRSESMSADTAATLQLVARHTAHVARSGALDPDPDDTRRQEPTASARPLRSLDELGPAQAAAAELSRRHPLSVDCLRAVAIGQARIALACRQALPSGDPSVTVLRGRFARRAHLYRAVAATTTRVASTAPGSRPAVWQVAELLRQTQPLRNEPVRTDTVNALAALDGVSPQVARAIAATTGRAFATGRYLVPDTDATELAWRRIRPGETPALLAATSMLAEHDRPTTPGKPSPAMLRAYSSRMALRVELDQMPLPRPPAPNARPSGRPW